jgi:ADP-dependent phosphofructokinase/glucokinase
MGEIKLPEIFSEVFEEVQRARNLYTAFNSNHEGYATLLEELDELWDEIKKNKPREWTEEMRKEAIQVAAMAVRFIYDRCTAKGRHD